MSYNIGKAASKVGLTPHTLRYYEKEGLIKPVGRNDKKVRVYTDDDIEAIAFVCCLKETGMPIADIKDFIMQCWGEQNMETLVSRHEILLKHRQRALEDMKRLNKNLEKINYKIGLYDEAICKEEKNHAKF